MTVFRALTSRDGAVACNSARNRSRKIDDLSSSEKYWHSRALAETKSALGSDDPHIASLHVDLATRCVRKVLEQREPTEKGAS